MHHLGALPTQPGFHFSPARPEELSTYAGDDQRQTKVHHQESNHTELCRPQSASTESTALLLRSNRHSSVTETPRGIVAKSVVDRIIAEL